MAKKLELEAIFKGVDRISRPIAKMQRRIGKFTRRATRGVKKLNRFMSKLSRRIGKGLKRGLQAATVALTAFGVAAAKVIGIGAEFEKTLVSAAVKFPGKIRRGTEAFQRLEDAARKTGETTEFTATQAAQGLDFLAMAGFDAEQAIASLGGIVDLATLSQVELQRASDIATDTLGAFGLTSKNAAEQQKNLTRVIDVMAKTSVSANTTLEQLFEAIVAGGPAAVRSGKEIEEFSALVGIMANAGIKGETAGTALRNMFFRLQAPAGKARGLIKQFIGEIEDKETGKLIKTSEILARLTKSMGELSDVKQNELMSVVFGLRAIGPAAVTLGAGAETIDEFMEKLKEAGGTSDEMASEIRDTLSGSLDTLKSTIEGVMIDLFKLDDEGIRGVVDGITEWIRANKGLITTKIGDFIKDVVEQFKRFRKFAKEVQLVDKIKSGFELLGKAIAFVIKNFKAITTIAAVILGISAAVKVLTTTMTLLNIVMAANPLTLIIMGLVAVTAFAVGAIIANWEDIVFFFRELGRGLARVGKGIWDGLVTIFTFMWSKIKHLFEDGVGFLILGPIGILIKAVKEIIENWGPIKVFFKDLWAGIVDIFTAGWNKIKDIFGSIGKGLKWFGENVLGYDEKGFVGRGGDSGGDTEDSSQPFQPQLISPQERTARLFEERNLTTTNKTELTIKDESGRAEVTGGTMGSNMSLEPTGTF